MKRRFYIWLLMLCCLSPLAQAGTVMFEEANKLYHNRQYVESAKLYTQIINDGLHSSSVFYNAGNAYYKCKQFGMAVWCYEKALQYEPENISVQENLALTNAKLKNPNTQRNTLFNMAWLKDVLHFHTMNKWCIGALAFYLVFMSIHITRKLRKTPAFFIVVRKLAFWLFIIYSLGAMANYVFHRLYQHGVVLQTTKGAWQDRSVKTKGQPIVAEGTVVQVLAFEKRTAIGGGRYKVKLPSGSTVWVDAQVIRVL
jgi:tetratricopeptide (TPR) repeat protein